MEKINGALVFSLCYCWVIQLMESWDLLTNPIMHYYVGGGLIGLLLLAKLALFLFGKPINSAHEKGIILLGFHLQNLRAFSLLLFLGITFGTLSAGLPQTSLNEKFFIIGLFIIAAISFLKLKRVKPEEE